MEGETKALRRDLDRYRRDLQISIQEQAHRDEALKEARAAIEIKDRYVSSLQEALAQKENDLRALQSVAEPPRRPDRATVHRRGKGQPVAEEPSASTSTSTSSSAPGAAADVDAIRAKLEETEARYARESMAFRTREDLLLASLQQVRGSGEIDRARLVELTQQVQRLEQERRRSEESRDATAREFVTALRIEKLESVRLQKGIGRLQREIDAVEEARGHLAARVNALEEEAQRAQGRISGAAPLLVEAVKTLEIELGWREERHLAAARQLVSDGLREIGVRTLPAPVDDAEIVACTIISKNYLSLARAWNASFRRHHPGAKTYVLLVDRLEGAFDPAQEDFELIEVDQLGIPEFTDFAFKYTILEINTAVKPYFLDYLFRERGVERLLYFDPDIFLFAPVEKIRGALRGADILLTPHILSPIPPDGKRPDEMNLLVSGAFNLGFIGLKRGETASRFLTWWQTRVFDHCFSSPERGLFTDQKWMDLVPTIFPDVAVLKDPGYNAAYWNLHERLALSREEDAYRIGEDPLVFFHFSGLDPDRPEEVSRHQSRFRLRHLSGAHRQLFSEYVDAIRKEGWEESKRWNYSFGRFRDGVRIPEYVRRLYYGQGESRSRWGDPFSAENAGSFRAWLLEPGTFGSRIPRLLSEIYRMRMDLQTAFPDGEFAGAKDLLHWAVRSTPGEYDLDDFFVQHFYGVLSEIEAEERKAAQEKSPPPPAPEPAPQEPTAEELVALRYAEPPQRSWKRTVERVLRPQVYRKLRRGLWHLRRPAPAAAAPETASAAQAQTISPAVPAPQPLPFGVNLFGYFDTESGVGEIARNMAKTLEHAKVPLVVINIEQPYLRRLDRTIADFSFSSPYAINLFMVNADQVPIVASQVGARALEGRRNVGYWFWELSRFPPVYSKAFSFFDEIWVASKFCLDSISSVSPIPVVNVPPGLSFEMPRGLDTNPFGIRAEDFVFLYVFDGASSIHRKNPAGVVTAFRKAFPGDGPERLILKTVNARTSQVEALHRLSRGARVDVITHYVSRPAVLDLIAVSDCYVSLHRSEGFGLTLLEAMSLGKPVIATNYSGNSDFLQEANGYPIGYRLVPIRRNLGPYGRGNVWADPDLDQAAAAMRRVRERTAEATAKGARAAEDVCALWGLEAAAPRVRERLERLRMAPGPA